MGNSTSHSHKSTRKKEKSNESVSSIMTKNEKSPVSISVSYSLSSDKMASTSNDSISSSLCNECDVSDPKTHTLVICVTPHVYKEHLAPGLGNHYSYNHYIKKAREYDLNNRKYPHHRAYSASLVLKACIMKRHAVTNRWIVCTAPSDSPYAEDDNRLFWKGVKKYCNDYDTGLAWVVTITTSKKSFSRPKIMLTGPRVKTVLSGILDEGKWSAADITVKNKENGSGPDSDIYCLEESDSITEGYMHVEISEKYDSYSMNSMEDDFVHLAHHINHKLIPIENTIIQK